MPHWSRAPTRRTGVAAAAVTAALLQLVLAVSPAAADDSLALEVRPLLGGRFVAGGWLAIEVRLANDGTPRAGHVAVDGEDGTVYRPVELPAGSRKQLVVYVRPAGFSRQVEARFEEAGGGVLATGNAQVRALAHGTNTLIVGDGGGRVRAQLVADQQARGTEPVTILPTDLPARAEPLKGISTVVWAADSTRLTDGQRRGLERWIASGGHLVIIGGADWHARSAAFGDLLPIGSLAAIDEAEVSGLASLTTAAARSDAEPWFGPLTIATGDLRDGAVAMASADDGSPLLAGISLGAGRVSYLAADMGATPLATWPDAPALWGRLLGGASWTQHFGGFPIEEEQAGAMAQAIGQLPALAVPPAELLLTVIVGYILLIGPVNYVILRRIDRRELAWVTAPLLVVMFSAGTYGIGSAMKGSSVILNEIAVVRTAVGGSAASVQTYAGIFSPSRSTYDLTVHGDALLAALDTSRFGVTAQRRSYLTEQGDPARLRGLQVSVFGLEAIRADTTVDYRPWLEVSWQLAEGRVEGSVLNSGPEMMEDVAVINAGAGVMVGNLAPGERQEFTLRSQARDGRSPVDAVYGFMGFDPRNDDQRRTLARRSVIESLIGYHGWGAPWGEGVDRGPYVIGWRNGPGPVAVEVEGERLQHFAQTVEVVAGRPGIGPGSVHLGPAQLSVRVVATDGEAIEHEPGYVSIGNGSATFRIALPIDAVGLTPTKLTLMVGGDPGMVIFEEGNFGGFFPNGYEMRAWNLQTDDWELVGDISRRSRFQVDDPSAFIDPSGQITVRITGNDVPDQFGHTGVFVGASVAGVIDR